MEKRNNKFDLDLENYNMQIIGIAGKAGSGKDYVANKLKESIDGKVCVLHFADVLKIVCYSKNKDLTLDDLYHTKGEKVRTLLQQEGTKKGRMVYGENLWLRALEAMIYTLTSGGLIDNTTTVIIPDVRFVNEAKWITENGGKVYKIVGRQGELSANCQAHTSETTFDDPKTDKLFEKIIKNNGENDDFLKEFL
jgi:phosphomevalonate kinase